MEKKNKVMLKFNLKISFITSIVFIGIILLLFFIYFKAFENRNTNSRYYKFGVTLFNFNILTVEGDEKLKKNFHLKCKDENEGSMKDLVKNGNVQNRPKSFKGTSVINAYFDTCLVGKVYIAKQQDWWSFDYRFKIYRKNDSIYCQCRILGPKDDFNFISTPCYDKSK